MTEASEKYAIVKNVSQYYRDSLSQSFEFPAVGDFPVDLVRWVVAEGNTDSVMLAELLQRVSSQLPPEQDLALKLMFFTILHANLALQIHNRAPDYSLSPAIVENIKRSLMRVLSLHPDPSYFVNTVQLLFRIKQIEVVLTLSKSNPQIFQESEKLQAIMAFIHILGNEPAQAIEYLKPFLDNPQASTVSLVPYLVTTCQYFMGEIPTWPFSFHSLKQDLKTLPTRIGKLPEMEMLYPPTTNRPIVFVACNNRYFFQHTLHLAYSLHHTNAQALALHLHLYMPSAVVLAELAHLRARLPELPISVSVEYGELSTSPPPISYYASGRFIRAYQVLEQYSNEMVIMDADALFNRSWSDFLAMLKPNSELGLACPSASPFWERVIAGFLYLKPTALARHFLAHTAMFILDNFERELFAWFLDQVALSISDDRFTRENPAVCHLPSEELIDTHCTRHALTWAATNDKSGTKAYQERREILGARYGQLQQADPAFLFAMLQHDKVPVFFLQIGAMDGVSFDPLHPHVKAYGWKGILVEPLPDMMQRLQANYADQPDLIFDNVAITEQDEMRTLYRILPETAEKAQLPSWVLGMSTFVPGKLDDYKSYVIEQPVTCLSLNTLLKKHNPQKIDVLQIDTEGYDFKILRQFDFTRYQPSIINLEYVNLSPAEKVDCQTLLQAQGYVFYENEFDLFAVKRTFLFRDYI